MRKILAVSLVVLALAGCVAPPQAPEPALAPVTRPTPTPAPPPAPLASDWNDWPFTPGDWRYASREGESAAVFGPADDFAVALTCDKVRHRLGLVVSSSALSPIIVRTTTLTRTLSTDRRSGQGVIPPSTAQADLAVTDPLLDAIAFSRGRFVVDHAGQPPLVLRPYAEIGRVIEDCRG